MDDTNKRCLVCEDKSNGRNFGAQTCESCKAYFRRNAHRFEEYECKNDNKCTVSLLTRTFCRACRLKKCFDVGMREDWIMSDSERNARKLRLKKRQKLEENDTKNDCSQQSYDSLSDSSSNSDLSIKSLSNDKSNSLVVYKNLENNLFNDDNDCDLSEFLIFSVPKSITDYNNCFNEKEFSYLNELLSATQHLQRNFIPIVTTESTNLETIFTFILNKGESDMSKMITVCNNLRAFKTISDDNQICLLKIGLLQMILLRSIDIYDKHTNSWCAFKDNESMKINLEFWKWSNKTYIYSLYEQYYENTFTAWDGDPIIIDMLMVILLFNPNRNNLTDKVVVKLQRNIYVYLLRRYLTIKYQSEIEAKKRLLVLMKSLKIVENLGLIQATNYINHRNQPQSDLKLMNEVCSI
ncbi:nuclear hormone receptor HR96-like [Oppia nitens]|uniref:nuclear hormone receptor HR96-like n=1 Tax=Oppia nitens TaxID=1686743 RepID=UPI0023DB45D3|nr:nuclear hormone receptor HR96-like [Oppia nitens]